MIYFDLFESRWIFLSFCLVPAFQFLGVLPLAVMKGTLSKLVEPQEQGKLIGKW